MKSMSVWISGLSLLGVLLLPLPMRAGVDPVGLTIHIDEQVTPIELGALKNGQSRTLEHHGHKVEVRREQGQLKLRVDGQKVMLGGDEKGGAEGLTCVVKVGNFMVEEGELPPGADKLEWQDEEGASSRLQADDVKVVREPGGQKTIQLKTGDGQTETLTVSQGSDGKVTVTARDEQGREKPVEGNVTSTQGKTKVVIVGSGEEPSPGGEGKVVMVRKHVVAHKTEEGVEGRKVVVRCVGEGAVGAPGGPNKVLILQKSTVP